MVLLDVKRLIFREIRRQIVVDKMIGLCYYIIVQRRYRKEVKSKNKIKKEIKKMKNIIITIIGILLGFVISYGTTAALVYLVCWAFGISFSFKLALGVWAIICLISSIIKAAA